MLLFYHVAVFMILKLVFNFDISMNSKSKEVKIYSGTSISLIVEFYKSSI